MAQEPSDGGTAGTGQAEASAKAAEPLAPGQGDDLDNRLGGREGGGAAPGAPASGDAGDRPSETGSGDGLGGADAGSPGGMGGVGVSGATGTGRPPGGVSPVQNDQDGT